MDADTFIKRWDASTRNETAGSKPHFLDLCTLLDVPLPTDDPTGTVYAFEKHVAKANGRKGWADVWFKGHFGWEYKSKGRDLEAAHDQLLRYAGALENPPLLITSDMARIVVRTNFTNTVTRATQIDLEALRDASTRDQLRDCWLAPDRWKPSTTRQALTERAAGDFAQLAERLRKRGHAAEVVAHFVNRLVFCLFANDVRLLPNGMLGELLALAQKEPGSFADSASMLFHAMSERGGRIGFRPVPWFNGGLFDDDATLPLTADDIALLNKAATNDWSQVDPSIFGTLFERGLDPGKRSQLGAHYTDRAKIELLIQAVITRPFAVEWEAIRSDIAAAMSERAIVLKGSASAPAAVLVLVEADAITAETQEARKDMRRAAERRTRKADALLADADKACRTFLERLRAFRVLDPACGSGNFLYVAMLALKDLELRVSVDAEAMGLEPSFPAIGPEAVLGIEINTFAVELARVSVWIGHIQWARSHGYPVPFDPVLRKLKTIECRDALLNQDGTEATWPAADVIVGNPPFLGAKEMRSTLTASNLATLRCVYETHVAGGCDLVTYWVFRSARLLSDGQIKAFGLITTNKIRNGQNLSLLATACEQSRIAVAWSDLPWVVAGASVRTSLICLDRHNHLGPICRLNGLDVPAILPNLTSSQTAQFRPASALLQNKGVAFVGGQKDGPFDISSEEASRMISAPSNPNGRNNSDVVRPWCNGLELARRPTGRWIIDFGEMTLEEAQFYEMPFSYIEKHVAPTRQQNGDKHRRKFWWQHGRPASRAKAALGTRGSMIVTPLSAKHRWFTFLPAIQFPDNSVVVITRDDDCIFGILSSRLHVIWAMRQGNFLGAGNDSRYTPSTTFDTFAFPQGFIPGTSGSACALHQKYVENIVKAARRLAAFRDAWLNPSDLVELVPGLLPGLSDRPIAKNARAAVELKTRTMTALYNQRPTWLSNAHSELDEAVAAAYGWPADLSENEVLAKLLALNLERAAAANH